MMAENKEDNFVALCEGDGKIIAVNRHFIAPGMKDETRRQELNGSQLFEKFEEKDLEVRFRSFVQSGLLTDSFRMAVGGTKYSVSLRRLDGVGGATVLIEMQPSDAGDEERYLLEAGRLVSRVVHDFKNQLGGLKLYIAYLKKRFADQAEIVEIADKVSSSVNALVDQSSLVSAMTRPIKLAPEMSDLTAIAQSVISDHHRSAEERNVIIDLQIAAGAAQGFFDAQLMRSAIGGLIARAIESSPPSGTVDLRIDQRGGKTLIEVRDQGETPSADRLRSMFDFVGPERLTRISLGLAMARRIVELHGGRMSARPATDAPATGAILSAEIPIRSLA